MKHSFRFLLFSAAMLLFAASCKKIHADGPVVSETRQHSGFTAISSSVDATVIFTESPDYRVEIRAQQDILDKMRSEVEGGELRFYYPGAVHIGRHDGITIHISGPDVRDFLINGSGELRSSNLHADEQTIRLRINGSGNISIPSITAAAVETEVVGSGKLHIGTGSVDRESCRISGSGDIDVHNLDAEDVTARISGSGTIRTAAYKTLDVHISGSGKVYYTGAPRITTSISGSGKVQPI